MGTAASPPVAGPPPSIGGEVASGVLRRLTDTHPLVHADWTVDAAESRRLERAPTILVSLRGSAHELDLALSLGACAYVELGHEGELPAGLLAFLAGPPGMFLSLSTATSFSLDMAPLLCGTLVCRGWLDPGRRADVEICLHEAVSNAIVHGNLGIPQGPSADAGAFDGFFRTVQERLTDPVHARRRVTVEAVVATDELRLHIRDEGRGHQGQVPATVGSLEAKSGRGLRIMGDLADRVAFSDAGRTTSLYFRR